MTHTAGPDVPRHGAAPLSSLNYVVEAKLQLPPPRATWVERRRLTDAMVQAVSHPVTLVAAPAGYGKTTLVAQWLHGPHRPSSAWVSLDAGDNDPDRLWSHVAAALERAGCPMPGVVPSRVFGSRTVEAPKTLLPAIIAALAATPDDLVLVLDDFHVIQSTARDEELQTLVRSLPSQAHLVIISRSDPGLKLGRLRVSHDLAEIRGEDLAFTVPEAREMLAHKGVELTHSTLTELVRRAEGWPAALYLAALSLADRPDPDAFVQGFSGGHRFIGDYLTEEVLSRNPDRLRDFILDVSVLDRFSAELCDHVLGKVDSAAILHDLERANLFLVPIDGERLWFRFHHLFAAVARIELELTRPEHVRALHARAAEWFSVRGDVSEAVQHWLSAGQPGEAGRLVQAYWLRFVDAGRAATVRGWLDSIGAGDGGPESRVTAAWMAALVGDEREWTRQLESLDGLEEHGPLPDGSRSIGSAVAQMRGMFGFGGPFDMMAAARRAAELETDPRSAQFAIAQTALGHARYVQGDLDGAVAPLQAAARTDGAPGIVRVLALSLQSFVQGERGDPTRAREYAEQAMDVLDEQGLRAAPQASWAFVALAQAQAEAGKSDDAISTLELGLSMRRASNAQGVWGPIHHLLWSSELAARLGQVTLARDLLIEVTERMSRFSDGMDVMHARVDAVRQRISDDAAPELAGEPLTEREVDVLRLLQGPMSLQEIASELYLSANTVKTHARAVYRKLGAHSRADAVRLARQRSLM